VEDCLLWEGLHAGTGKSVRCPPREEEGEAETTCDDLTAPPILCHPCATRVEELEKIGSEVEPRKYGGIGERCL